MTYTHVQSLLWAEDCPSPEAGFRVPEGERKRALRQGLGGMPEKRPQYPVLSLFCFLSFVKKMSQGREVNASSPG